MQLIYGLHFRNLKNDIHGGLIAAIVSLPLSLAFSVASGAGPVAGIWCAIICGFFAGVFGGTPTQISGPTGPLAIVMAALISQYAENPAVAFTVVIMAGAFQVLFGFMRFGKYVSLIPYPVITGFMTAIGVIIITMQLLPLLGQQPPVGGLSVTIDGLPSALENINYFAVFIGLLAFSIMKFVPRSFEKFLPRPLVALIGCSLLALILPGEMPKIGAIHSNPPSIVPPMIIWNELDHMVYTALIIAFLGSISSLMSSLVADNMTGKAHDSNREFIGQGVGNIICGLFGVIPGAGATMRTAANIRAGGRTPISIAIHCAVLMAIVLGMAPLAAQISYAVLAGILIKVGADIIDWSFLRKIHRIPRSAALFMLTVFFLTIFVNYIVAITVGMVLASLFLTKQMADQQEQSMQEINAKNAGSTLGAPLTDEEMQILKDYPGIVVLFEMAGALSFGASRHMSRRLRAVGNYEGLVLDFSNVQLIDDVSLLALEDIIDNNKTRQKKILLFGLKPNVRKMLEKTEIIDYIGDEYIHKTRLKSMRHAKKIADKTVD